MEESGIITDIPITIIVERG
ncbi:MULTISPECIES: hypothetical protein [Pectobacterium]|nr:MULTISPECIES: hypothetical protein [Pectobacterium]UKY59736.1 hypothetical protein MBA20_04935 [Pectobacterium brasiliense]UPY97233.1 hypothetical protein MYB54_04880 [Pectobacterium sp. 21LCBS03]